MSGPMVGMSIGEIVGQKVSLAGTGDTSGLEKVLKASSFDVSHDSARAPEAPGADIRSLAFTNSKPDAPGLS